eukprot:13239472-Heterocapsa_arctica.AAC.1
MARERARRRARLTSNRFPAGSSTATPNGCTKEAKVCTRKHKKVSAEEAKLLYKPGTKPGTGD